VTDDRSARRSLAIGAATNWAAFAAALAVSFFLAPYLIRGLGTERYGLWRIVESALAFFTLFDLGIAACLIRFVARHHAAGERDELNRIVSSCLAVFAAAAGCVLVLGAVLALTYGPALGRQLGGADDVPLFMLLMLVNLAATLPLSVFPSILDGLQRFPAKSAVRVVFLAARVGGIVLVTETRPGLVPLAAVYLVTNLLEHAALGVLAFRFLPGLRVGRRLIDRETLRRVRGYSADAFLAMLAGRVTVRTGVIVVGGFGGLAAAAAFGIAAQLVDMAKDLLRYVTTTLTPAVSEREAKGDFDGIRAVLLTGTRWVLYLVLPVHLGLLFFGRPFLATWLKDPVFADACFPAAAVLSATLTIGVTQSVGSRILYGMGRLRLFARMALVEAGLNLTLSLALVGPLGAVGVALAVAVPNVLFCLFVIGYTCRVLEVSAGRYLLAGWARPLAAAVVPAVVWWFATPAAPTYAAISAALAVGAVPYAVVVLMIEVLPRVAATRSGARTDPRVAVTRVSTLPVPPVGRASARG
jgi:O-antigen/teichoic acid export membrane protein